MYLHNRNTDEDFINIIKENRNKFNKGIVHSFTGNENEMNNFLNLNLYIGLTGTSFKTKENIEVAKKIPLDKLIIETDAPYCEIKRTSEGYKYIETFFDGKLKKEKMKKGFICKERNEPCTMIQVLEVISKIKNVDKEEVCKMVYKNSLDLFGLKDD
jgi:TatD DNase family protein